ncbi:DNA-binding transcriptional LysR family regulator [Kitasatospora sp. GAS204A]|uniref:LysR family transcriptional regulator n=1 Tax=unclassified Kitasatospora TaxID=2633591 RepID=UPI002476BF8A|nr:LysR family transcriptional regulator [Kitasatospora sp. GAS204B]MDH6118821.1 DNA-binding transcriptional LysR family regulator [Kitasatospora sp. GAS204B]
MAVSLRQLEYFVAVVDEGSFTAAAQLLHVSQPGLSHQIQALERELGGPLLERLPRRVRLTPAGRTVLPHARASLAHAERAGSAGRRANGIATGELHVGTLYSISTGVLPHALRAWRRNYPELRVQLVEFRHSDDLVAAMEAGNADLAVGPTPPNWDGPTREIGTEEFLIVAASDADLPADTNRIRLADLAEHEWIHFTPQSGLSEILDHACNAVGFTPRVAVRAEQSPTALNLALAGLGLALIPGNNIPPRFEGTLLRPDPPVLRPLSVYTRVRPDPITAAFVEAIADRTLVTPPHIEHRLRSGS